MSDAPTCRGCQAPIGSGVQFCTSCGLVTGQVVWRLAVGPAGAGDAMPPGGRFAVVAANHGYSAVRARIDVQAARGVVLESSPVASLPPGVEARFVMRHDAASPLSGLVRCLSDDGPRGAWYERRSWRTETLSLAAVRVRPERWVVGSPNIVLPPGVRRQAVRVWNDSDRERALELSPPAGYRVLCYGRDVASGPLSVGALNSEELTVEPLSLGAFGAPDAAWQALPDASPVPLIRLPLGPPRTRSAVVVAIDLGTRNTRVRVRWRTTVVPTKPAGTEDTVIDVPAAMVLHRQEHSFWWGREAANRIDRNLLGPDEVALTSLKTYLREGIEDFVRWNPAWTNRELLARYVDRVINALDDYLSSADPAAPLSREGLPIQFVVTRPVMDLNEGDAAGKAYESALRDALTRAGIAASDVLFVLEPVAAAKGIAAAQRPELLELKEGAEVAVVDAGGGTTDVSLARVRLADGRITLEVTGSYDLRVGPDNPAMASLKRLGLQDDQFGGNTLDAALADRLLTRPAEVLESDAGAPPARLDVDDPARFPTACRRMKEGFAWSSRQYLYRRPAGQAAPPQGDVYPFPNRADLAGVHLPQQLYDEQVQAPIVAPIVRGLVARAAAGNGEAVKPGQVRRVFYVGGTSIDPFFRLHFRSAFPLAPQDTGAQDRIEERLGAVVRGAVWFDDQVLPRSPLDAWVRLGGDEASVVRAGDSLMPAAQVPYRVRTQSVEPGQEMEAVLVVAGPGLEQPVEVARAMYRNETDSHRDVALRIRPTSDRGICADLVVGTQTLEQWRFVLVEGGP